MTATASQTRSRRAPETPVPVRRGVGRVRRKATTIALLVGVPLALLTAAHALVPDVLGLGLVWDNALPWTWVVLPVLVLLVLVARTPGAVIGLLAPTLVWGFLFGPGVVPLGDARQAVPAAASLSVASQNLGPAGDPAVIAGSLAASGADLIALQEIEDQDREPLAATLDADYPYSVLTGTVGLWSRYPIEDSVGLKLGLDWYRAINAVVETPSGAVSVYVIHADSARPGAHAERDVMLEELAEAVAANTRDRVVVMGDFNASASDRALAALQSEVSEPNQSEGGFGLTWPAGAPLMRLDHVFVRGMVATHNAVGDAQGSDHHGIVSSFRLDR
ncbi:endonuclease/exonuclease/phosphatase family protein [Plantibacter sp. LMC-P-059a]|uniref:endonuclease/exonuclease/phosphatase family protein n=1 Tax=Plantibacter sp. LMC-P-059a TaxID=3040297 RepID=UPI0025503838|nr:endonuclease/exonuclease/phosphatase family protein [Plantibacter sp. LMC-P-059a]